MQFSRPVLFSLLYLLSLVAAFGQNDTVTTEKSWSYLNSYPRTMVAMGKSPFHWNTEKWFQFGGSVVLVGALIPMDQVLNIPFENWQASGAIKFGEAGDVVGGIPFQFGLTGAALGVGLISGNKQWQHFALDNLQAQLFTGGITWVIKELTHRARPEAGEENFAFYGPFKGGGNVSFFSGHTSLAFSTATMIFLHSDKKWWVGVLGYGAATAVGMSRMQQQKHWASDVVAGALVGSAVSRFVYLQQEKRRANKEKLKPLP